MKTANCKNCGPLPIGEFYPNLNSPTRKPMAVCKKCHGRRATRAQKKRLESLDADALLARKLHGLKAYWSGCRCRTCKDAHAEYERNRYAGINIRATQINREAVQLKLFVETQIRLLTKNGASRELIRRETKAPWDLITDTLAELWDAGELVTRKHGDDRLFYLKAA